MFRFWVDAYFPWKDQEAGLFEEDCSDWRCEVERSHHLLPSHGGCRRWHTSLGYLDARLERWRAACIDFVLDIFRKFVSSACNTQKIPRGNAFFNNLGALLADLKQNTAFSGYDYKASRAGSGGAPTAYGQANCKQSLSQSDCTACLSNLVGRIWGICSNAIGARVQLTDCFIRYEQYSF